MKLTSKEEAMAAHNTHIQVFERKPDHLLVYSDGSMLEEERVKRRVGQHMLPYIENMSCFRER